MIRNIDCYSRSVIRSDRNKLEGLDVDMYELLISQQKRYLMRSFVLVVLCSPHVHKRCELIS
jgi:hypothetical protein